MQNILLINGKKDFHFSHGRLNTTLQHVARTTLEASGKTCQETIIDDGYDIQKEIEKYLWADVIIYQMPGWWMSGPWIVKEYMDEVFTAGHGKLYESDGRTRHDPEKKYGSGGLLWHKKYMISTTWNAPLEAFTEKDQFFEGMGIDGVFFAFHKANQFLGMKPLTTFLCIDVIKDPKIDNYIEEYKKHLNNIFG